MQDHPGAPGSARQGNTGTDVPAACGGAAAQSQAPGHSRPRATPTPMPMPKAPDHNRSRAVPMPQALGHTRSRAASMAPSGHAGRGPASAGPSVPMTTAPLPACVSRLLQEVLLRVAATPHTLIHPQSRQNTAKTPHCEFPNFHRPPIPLRHLPRASCPAGADPPAACHRGHGLPTPTPLARPAPGRPPKTYPSQFPPPEPIQGGNKPSPCVAGGP